MADKDDNGNSKNFQGKQEDKEKWRRFIRENMQEGESFEEAAERLRKVVLKNIAKKHGLSYPVIMPNWSKDVRAMPNSMLRSALFGAIGKGRRRYLECEPIASLCGLNIIYTGIQLDQGDLDVYESVLHHLRSQEMGEANRITSYSLLKLIGKTDTGKNRDILHKRLSRLCANAIEITQERYTYMGSLIHEAFKDKETREWIIVLNPTLRVLFEPNQFTLTDWDIRRKLSGHSLAQWLYGFYASHAEPFSIKIETLRELCGSETELLKHFKEKLRKALDAVAEAFNAVGQKFSYEIKDGLVYVRKQPSKSQQRYLERKNRNN